METLETIKESTMYCKMKSNLLGLSINIMYVALLGIFM